MPLDSYLPKIDDRRFDDLMAEVRTRIARYTPEWTPVWSDVNETDPGVTMIEIFAWMTDLTLYRLNKVPALSYLKFLELIGIELRAAEPAHAEVTFPVLPSTTATYVIVPARTPLSADPGDGLPSLTFETDSSSIALRSRLVTVLAYDGFTYGGITAQNDAGTAGFEPFGPLAGTGSALLLGFDGPLPSGVDLALTVWTASGTGPPAAVSCGLPASRRYPSARLGWEFWNGKAWQSLDVLKDETVALTVSGRVHLRAPLVIDQPADFGGVASRQWIRARVLGGGYERTPELLAIRTNTTSASQVETFRDEVAGGSDGRPNQVLRLENPPVVDGTLVLEVDEGEGFLAWTAVPDLFGSGADDRHYVLDRSTGEVRFGDGTNGRIPIAYVDNPAANIVARIYRSGGGQRGNVKAGLVKTLQTSVPGVDETAVANLQAAYGARDEESLDSARKRAPLALKSGCRAVTAEDFEAAAESAGNVRRARALPLSHPDFPGVQVPGVITVVVVPDANPEDPRPMPSDGLLRTVCAALDQRRLLTTEVYVVPPTYLEIAVAVDVIVRNDADLAEVKTEVEASLLDYFHPLRGGETGEGWPFGGDVFYSRVQHRVFSVPGVERVERLTITLDGEEQPDCADVPVADAVLLFCLGNEVSVRYSFEE
jgi:predicted phage baseplate assembly protein